MPSRWPMRWCSPAVLLLVALLAGARPAAAQPLLRPTPLAEARADRDGDTLPDALGDTLTVAGRALVADGVLHRTRLDLYIDDGTAGLRLVAAERGAAVAPGDSVVAVGVLEQDAGLTQLAVAHYRRIDAAPRPPAARSLGYDRAALEAHEGRLVEIEGYVAGKGHNPAGTYLTLSHGDSAVVAFLFDGHGSDAVFDKYQLTDFVRITGIVGQFDRGAPFDAGYQLYPRGAADLRVAAIPGRRWRAIGVGVSAMLLIVLGWVVALRRQVRRRVAELRRSETRYRHLFDHAGDALFVHDLRLGTASTFTEVNNHCSVLLGYARERFEDLTLDDLVAPASLDVLLAHLRTLRADGQAVSEMLLVTEAGRVIPFEISSHVFALDDRPTVLSIARDVTERKAYEQGLIEARQEAEALARLKSSFLANMSHEIRTPLTSIIGFADVLTEDVGGPGRELARLIRRSGQRLMDTLNSVLDLTRLDANEVQPRPAPIDVVAEVEMTVRLLDPLAQKKKLPLRFTSEHGSVPAVQDLTCLHRIVNNLVGNAIKFTKRGEIEVTLSATPTEFCLKVRDTGVGIDASFLPSLFDEFKQESTGLGRSHEGAGLGLAITRRLVEMLGGQISVLSEKGKGSTFTVVLPRLAPGIESSQVMRPE